MTRRRVMTPAQMDAVADHVRRTLQQQGRYVEDAAAVSGLSRRVWDKVIAKAGNVEERSLRLIAKGLGEPPRRILELAGYDVSDEPADPTPVVEGDPSSIRDEIRRLVARLEAAGLLPPELPDEPREGPGAQRRRQPRGGPQNTRRKGIQGTS